MKKILILFIAVLGGIAAQAQEIKWMSFEEALQAQKKNPKPLFVDVYTHWCGPCKMLDQNTFSDANVAKAINSKYYPVKFNAEGNESITFNKKKYSNPNFDATRTGRNSMHQLTGHLRIQGYPSMVIIASDGTVSQSIVGYRTPEQLLNEVN